MPTPTLTEGSRAALASSAQRTLLRLLKDTRRWDGGTWFLARNLLDGVVALQEVDEHEPSALYLRLQRDVEARLEATTRFRRPAPQEPRRKRTAASALLVWDDNDRAEGRDGSVYLLSSEHGLHEPVVWSVIVYRPGDVYPSESLGQGGALSKRDARALAERDARGRMA